MSSTERSCGLQESLCWTTGRALSKPFGKGTEKRISARLIPRSLWKKIARKRRKACCRPGIKNGGELAADSRLRVTVIVGRRAGAVKEVQEESADLFKEASKFGAVRKVLKIAGIEVEFKTMRGDIHVFTTWNEEYRKLLACIKNCGARIHWFVLE